MKCRQHYYYFFFLYLNPAETADSDSKYIYTLAVRVYGLRFSTIVYFVQTNRFLNRERVFATAYTKSASPWFYASTTNIMHDLLYCVKYTFWFAAARGNAGHSVRMHSTRTRRCSRINRFSSRNDCFIFQSRLLTRQRDINNVYFYSNRQICFENNNNDTERKNIRNETYK